MSSTKRKRDKSTSRKGRILKGILLAFIFIVVVAGASAGVFLFQTLRGLELPAIASPFQTTFVYDDKNEVYTTFHGEEDRLLVEYTEIPDHVKNAFVAIEDERFWQHHGVDLEAIGRAAWKIMRGGRKEGGSTITQQFIKNSLLTPERTIKRKLQEQWLAIQLERKYSKQEIMQMYLNRIFFGHYAYGIETASHLYFGKSVSDLSIAEGALLAGVVQRPNYYSPYNSMEKATERRDVVIAKMAQLGFITPEQANIAKQETVVLSGSPRKDSKPYPQFTWYMKEGAKEALIEAGICQDATEADQLIFTGGLHIYTTLDQSMQTAVEHTVVDIMENEVGGELEPDDETMGPQVAAMIIDHRTGEVKAAVGDRDVSKNGLKRYSQSTVTTGSSIKPLLDYAAAIAEHGYTAGTVVDDAPVSYPEWGSRGKPYRPRNYHNNFKGLVTVRTAIVRSLNIPAVKTFLDVGIKNAIDFAERLGINNEIHPYPSSALGSSELTLEEMTRAFGVFGNRGVLVAEQNNAGDWQNTFVTKIVDSDGNVLYESQPQMRVVMDENSSYIMTNILGDVVGRYSSSTIQSMNRPAAGKTGTSQGAQYVWFVGYTPQYVGGVWIGHDKYPYPPEAKVAESKRKWLERQDSSNYGGKWPALIWSHMMSSALDAAEVPIEDFVKPAAITDPITISSKSGLLAGPNTPEEFKYDEIFVKGTEPTEVEDLFKEVLICKDTHKLATEHCPSESIVVRYRMTRPTEYDLVDENGDPLQRPEDYIWEIPTETCDWHGPIEGNTPNNGSDSSPDGPDDSTEDSQTGNQTPEDDTDNDSNTDDSDESSDGSSDNTGGN